MIKLALTLVHNKPDNEAQIASILSMVTRITDTHDELDDQGNVVGQFETYHYEFNDLAIPHEVKFYHVVPFGVPRPSNMDELDGHKVIYGAGDEDKTGDHPRFFNWGLKRGTDHGAEVSVYLDNVKKFKVEDLAFTLTQAIDPDDKTELIEDAGCKIATLKLLKEVGQLDETKTVSEGILDIKDRVLEKGFKNG